MHNCCSGEISENRCRCGLVICLELQFRNEYKGKRNWKAIQNGISFCVIIYRFVLTLISNPLEPETDIGLEVTVSFRERSVVRNAKVSGKWGKEEKNIPYFPFTPMQHFKVSVKLPHVKVPCVAIFRWYPNENIKERRESRYAIEREKMLEMLIRSVSLKY